MKIGKIQKPGLIAGTFESLERDSLVLNLPVSGKMYEVDLSPYFLVDIDSVSDADLVEFIIKMQAHQFTFTTVETLLEQRVSRMEDELDHWLAHQMRTVYAKNVNSKLTDKKAMQFFLLTDQKDEFFAKRELIFEFKSLAKRLNKLQYIILQKIKFFEVILERRYLIKKGKGFNSGL